MSELDNSTLFPDVGPVLTNPSKLNTPELHSNLCPVGSPTLKFPLPSIQTPFPVPRALAAPRLIEALPAVAECVRVIPVEDKVLAAIVHPEAPPILPVLATRSPAIIASVAYKTPAVVTLNLGEAIKPEEPKTIPVVV